MNLRRKIYTSVDKISHKILFFCFLKTMNSLPLISPEPLSPESERSFCIALNLLGLSGLIFSITCVHIIAPLILWVLKRSNSSLIDRTGKEVLNFQISWTIYLFISGALCFILIGWLIFPFVTLGWLILMIRAVIKTSNGEFYAYPLTIRFLK